MPAFGGLLAPIMKTRFGQKIRMPSTTAIKHQILSHMLEDEIQAASGSGRKFNAETSPAVHSLRKVFSRSLQPGRN